MNHKVGFYCFHSRGEKGKLREVNFLSKAAKLENQDSNSGLFGAKARLRGPVPCCFCIGRGLLVQRNQIHIRLTVLSLSSVRLGKLLIWLRFPCVCLKMGRVRSALSSLQDYEDQMQRVMKL